jgi:hypothetical protein
MSLVRSALLSGSLASLTSGLALVACGWIERRTPAGPLNGPSQWVWGEHAAYERRATISHTVVGYAIHHVMSVGWAFTHEALRRKMRAETVPRRLAAGAATAALASFVDYQLTPRRLRPGFEKQLSRTSLFAVYAAFALGLAAGSRE